MFTYMVNVISFSSQDVSRVTRPATLLGRSIFDGIADGIDDSANNLLHGAFDDDDDFDVDPLCRLGGDRFELIDTLGEDISVPARHGSAVSVSGASESVSADSAASTSE